VDQFTKFFNHFNQALKRATDLEVEDTWTVDTEPTAINFDFIFAQRLPEVSSFCVATLVYHLRSILDYL
jgi:hypothetical protein